MTMPLYTPSFTISATRISVLALMCMFGGTLLTAGSAHATSEAAPSSWELSAPGSSAAQTAPEAQEAQAQAQPATPNPQAAAAAPRADRDPCPSPRAAQTSRPDDLAKVQEDIDRFTLCVQRAQLLERLNDSAERATESVDSALGFAPAGTLSLPAAGGAMPPLPANAMGGFDVTPAAPATASQSATPAGQTPANTTASQPEREAEDEKTAEASAPRWLIREIFGPVTDMQARLLSAQGDEVLVRQGTRLHDGGVVTTITPSGVTVRHASAAKQLEWSGN